MIDTNCWWGWPGGFFGGCPGMIVGVIFLCLLLYGIFLLFSRLAKRPTEDAGKQDTPMNILKQRYAKGEIDAAEFAQKKKDLDSGA